MTSVAFVGIGRMGRPMARNTTRAGFEVSLFDAVQAVAESAAQEIGAAVLTVPADFNGIDLVVTMLPTSEIVRHVLFEWKGGLAGALPPGAVVIDMSSSNPAETIRSAEQAARLGVTLVDAPVSGGVGGAEAGSLTIMLGGEDDAIAERVTPLLLAMGSRVVRTGPVGSAHAMKALNNIVAGATTMACFEALAAGSHYGLDPKTMVDVWNTSTAQSFVTTKVVTETVVTQSYDSGYSLPLYAKDVAVAASMMLDAGVDAPIADSVATAFRSAVDTLGDVDHTRAATLFASGQ